MIKWYLVLYIVGQGGAITTIQTPYNTKVQCDEASKDWDYALLGMRHLCVKANIDNADKGYVCQSGASICQVVK